MPDTTVTGAKRLSLPRSVHVVMVTVLIVAAIMLAFGDVPNCQFVMWDDAENIFNNRFLQPVSLAGLWRFWSKPYFSLYVPVTYTVWAGIASAFHLSKPVSNPYAGDTILAPAPFHTASLVVHVLNTLLVYALLRILVKKYRDGADVEWASGVGALVFALHPLQTEAVAWASEMRGLLSVFFGLSALHLYLNFTRAGGWWSYAGATLLFLLGMLSKPGIVILPLIVLLMIGWCSEGNGRSLLDPRYRVTGLTLGFWLLLGLAMIAITSGAQPLPASLAVPAWKRPWVAGDAVTFYLSRIVTPRDFGPDYGRCPSRVFADPATILLASIPLLLTGLFWAVRRRISLLWFGWLVFLAALLPVLGLKPFGFQEMSTVADRYAYLAMLGPAIVVSCTLVTLRHWAPYAVAGAALVFCTLYDTVQTEYWQNSLALARQAVAVNPKTTKFHAVLGLMEISHGNIQAALVQGRLAIAADPKVGVNHNVYGLALAADGDTPGAIREYRLATRMNSHDMLAWNNLGDALIRVGDMQGAETAYRSAIAVHPDQPEAFINLGRLLGLEKKYPGAISALGRAAVIQPWNADTHLKLGSAYLLEPDPHAAVREFQTAVHLDRDNPDGPKLLALALQAAQK